MEKTKISWFSYFGSAPKDSNLMWCLTTDRYKKEVETIRSTTDVELRKKKKMRLPGFTPSGLFSERNKSGLIKHSGYLCLDFDDKDNQHITDWQGFITYGLSHFSYITYAGLSVSGKGAFAIVPISEPKRHTQHFDALIKDFKHIAQVDTSGRDVGRLRFMSYNEHPNINHYADVYSDYIEPIRAVQRNYCGTDNNVQILVNKILATGTNIASSYKDWFALACSLREVPNGRTIFHDISSMDSRYQFEQCEYEFSKALNDKGNGRKIGIGTFFRI